MPSLFRRKSADLVEDPVTEAVPVQDAPPRPKNYTPGKGKATPKRPSAQARREAPPTDRKEAAKRLREKERAARAEQRAGMMAGDERYLLPRDRGPEKALARDVVDSRRTIGTWFFSFAFVLLGVSMLRGLPPQVVMVANTVWLALGFAVIADSVLICRKVARLVRERLPRSEQRMSALYMYAVMRSLSYRRLRVPKPRVTIGAKI